MSTFDASLFADVADALGISSPAIVEKDYYAVQLLVELSALSFEGYALVFSGGTCLAKAYQATYRMSEDVDIKMVPSPEILALSNNQQRQRRREVYHAICKLIESSAYFQLIEPAKKRSEGRYQQFLIQYPRHHRSIDALRPHLQLDITESKLLEPSVEKPIRSLYGEVTELENQPLIMSCVTMATTASEKFVSLLRRTAAIDRDRTRVDDETLVRHVYDLHLMGESLPSLESMRNLVEQVIQTDVEQFGRQHEAFRRTPHQELRHGLSLLLKNHHHELRYEKFIGPLVYHPSPARWDEAIQAVSLMSSEWLE